MIQFNRTRATHGFTPSLPIIIISVNNHLNTQDEFYAQNLTHLNINVQNKKEENKKRNTELSQSKKTHEFPIYMTLKDRLLLVSRCGI
jgi:hypothetical protein